MRFSFRIRDFSQAAIEGVERTRRAITISLFKAIIMDTPVDTGRLRGNWQTSIASPIASEIERYDKRGAQAVSEATEKAMESTGGDTVFMRNNLPYAERIEYDGWSHTKAPEGMVRKNFARIRRIVEQAARDARRR